ncbi:hypothetical protein AX17_003439 [Amanita inopinata Kibby_2008]|nr:hypothetical protein AX17_003439 [Amanita inopinata Kibby_2008]
MSNSATAYKPPSGPLSRPTPYQLRSLVLDYLAHQCYTSTAKAFLRDSTVKHFNADGDEVELPLSSRVDVGLSSKVYEEALRRADSRKHIKTCILRGRIDDATDLLNEQFPSVLSPSNELHLNDVDNDGMRSRQQTNVGLSKNRGLKTPTTTKADYVAPHSLHPAHLSLNLRIQAFIEACRSVPLIYAPRGRERNYGSTTVSDLTLDQAHSPDKCWDTSTDVEQQVALLGKAQKLYASVNMLPNCSDREQYHEELKNVAGLLAYKVPEKSLMGKYMSQERREAVADQIDSAILSKPPPPSLMRLALSSDHFLHHRLSDACANPVISTLELLARHVTTVWAVAHESGVKIQPGAVVPPVKGSLVPTKKSDRDEEVVPPFDINFFLDTKAAAC